MVRLHTSLLALLSGVLVLSALDARCVDANVLQLEIMKKKAAKEAQWKSSGSVMKSEVPGFYRHWPGPVNAFWLKSDGTGLLYGGQRGSGVWHMMWEFHPDQQTLTFRSVQLKREYKAIKKGGKVWFIKGRETWRQHIHMNAPINQPKDKAVYISRQPPKKLRTIP